MGWIEVRNDPRLSHLTSEQWAKVKEDYFSEKIAPRLKENFIDTEGNVDVEKLKKTKWDFLRHTWEKEGRLVVEKNKERTDKLLSEFLAHPSVRQYQEQVEEKHEQSVLKIDKKIPPKAEEERFLVSHHEPERDRSAYGITPKGQLLQYQKEIKQAIESGDVEKYKEKHGVLQALLSGVMEESYVGQERRAGWQDDEITKAYEEYITYEPQNTAEKIAYGVGSVIPDLPLYAMGGGIAGKAPAIIKSGMSFAVPGMMKYFPTQEIAGEDATFGGMAKTGLKEFATGATLHLAGKVVSKVANELRLFGNYKAFKEIQKIDGGKLTFRNFRKEMSPLDISVGRVSQIVEKIARLPVSAVTLEAASSLLEGRPMSAQSLGETLAIVSFLSILHADFGGKKIGKAIDYTSKAKIVNMMVKDITKGKRLSPDKESRMRKQLFESLADEKKIAQLEKYYKTKYQAQSVELAEINATREGHSIEAEKIAEKEAIEQYVEMAKAQRPELYLEKPPVVERDVVLPEYKRKEGGVPLDKERIIEKEKPLEDGVDYNIPVEKTKVSRKLPYQKQPLRQEKWHNSVETILSDLSAEEKAEIRKDPSILMDYVDRKASGYQESDKNVQGSIAKEIKRRIEDEGKDTWRDALGKAEREFYDAIEESAGRASSIATKEGLYQAKKFLKDTLPEAEKAKADAWENTNEAKVMEKERMQREFVSLNESLKGFENSISNKGYSLKEHTDPIKQIFSVTKGFGDKIMSNLPRLSDSKIQAILRKYIKNVPREVEHVFGENVRRWIIDPMRAAEHNFSLEKKYQIHSFQIFVKSQKFTSAQKERIATHMAGRDPNGLKTLEAMGKKPVDFEDLVFKEKEMVLWLDAEYAKMLKRINASRDTVGLSPIEGRDDYFTFIRKFNLMEQLGYNPLTAGEEAWKTPLEVHPKSFSFQFGKERVESTRGIELDPFNVFEKYLSASLRTIHMTPVIGKSREILEMGDFREKNFAGYAYLREHLDYISGVPVKSLKFKDLHATANVIHKNLALYTLAANINSIAVQPMAIINTLSELGVKSLKQGLGKFVQPKWQAYSMEHSKVLYDRFFDVTIEEMSKSFGGKLGRTKARVGEMATLPMRYLDMKTAQASWLAGYSHAREGGAAEKQAWRFADNMVIKTQASASRIDISPLQRTPAGKLMAMFQTFTINQFNWLADDLARNEKLTKAQKFKKLSTFLVAASLANTISHLGGEVFPVGWGEYTPFPSPIMEFKKALDEDKNLAQALAASGLELATFLPLVGGAKYGGKGTYGAGGRLLIDTMEYLSQSPDMEEKAFLKNGLTLAGKWLGIPGGGQIAKFIRRYARQNNKEWWEK